MKKFILFLTTLVMVVSIACVPAFAVSHNGNTLPSVPSNADYFLLSYLSSRNRYQLRVYSPDNGQKINFVYNPLNSSIEITGGTFDVLTYHYTVGTDSDWVYEEGNSVMDRTSSSLSPSSDFPLIASHGNIYSTDGSLFFGTPPLEILVGELVTEEIPKVQTETSGLMKILVPCGVGCLALLTALPLLRRKFSIFLP